MNCRESDGIGNVLLAQRKGVTLFTDHASGRDPLHEVQKQVGNALLGRKPTEDSYQLVRSFRIDRARFGQRHDYRRIRCQSGLHFSSPHSAHLDRCQGFHGKMKALFKDGADGEEITGQQEFQDLPAAIRKLNVSERPSITQNEHAVGRFVLSEYLCSRISAREFLPTAIALRFWRRWSKNRGAEPCFAMGASHAG